VSEGLCGCEALPVRLVLVFLSCIILDNTVVNASR
jgi:hypothetical protein